MALQVKADDSESANRKADVKTAELERQSAKEAQRRAIEEAQKKEQEAQGWGFWANFWKWVGAAVAAVVGVLGSVFTCGASLGVAAAVVSVLCTADQVSQMLCDAGVLPKEVANVISFLCLNPKAGGALVAEAMGDSKEAHWVEALVGDPRGVAGILKDNGCDPKAAGIVEIVLTVALTVAKTIVKCCVGRAGDAASDTAKTLSEINQDVQAAGAMVQAEAEFGQGGSTIEKGLAERDAMNHRADAKAYGNRATADQMAERDAFEQLKDLAEREDKVWQIAIGMGRTENATAQAALRA